jgi:Uma2 family endonuclease
MTIPPVPPQPIPAAGDSAGNGQQVWDLDPAVIPNLDELVSEDGKAVDNIYVERQYKLLTEPLYSSWAGPGEGRSWVALANVGWYHADKEAALVPDVLLSLDVNLRDPRTKEGRSYVQWVLGKQPDLVLEIVSDKRGGEDTYKLKEYARLGVSFYVIYDPENHLDGGVLRAFELRGKRYASINSKWIEDLGLGLTFWEGSYLRVQQTWLRWCDQRGVVLPTGAERADAIRREKDEQLDRLRAQLRAAGIEPEA